MLSAMSVSPRALHRRAKKYLLRNPGPVFVQTLPGFEGVAAQELRIRGLAADAQHGGVSLDGSLATVYLANLGMRTGHRVLLRIREFLAQTYPMLYDHARKPDWVAVLGNCPDYWIRVASRESRLRHSAHVRSAVDDAIRSRMHDLGLHPKLTRDAAITIHVRIFRDRCTLSLDTSGEHLHKRGYRTNATEAPIRETVAAALLILARSAAFDVVVDPFCGSGTFLIEAESIARKRPLALDRRLAIETTPLHAPGLMRHIRNRLLQDVVSGSGQRILGFDASPHALRATSRNIANAAASGIQVAESNAVDVAFNSLLAAGERGLVVANMPYGKRLGTPEAAKALLADFSQRLVDTARGWSFALISPAGLDLPHPDLVVERARHFLNGGYSVVCRFGHVGQR